MAYEEIPALLGGWEGFDLVGVERMPASTPQSAPQIVLTLRPVPTHAKRCSGCGEIVAALHDVAERRVRDLPILEAETWLILPRAGSAVRAAGRRWRRCRGSIGISG